MLPNFLVLLGAAFIPCIIGYIWFSPAVFGGEKWFNMAQMPVDKRTPASGLKILLTMLLNFLVAFGLANIVIHQFSIFGLVGGNVELLKTGTAAAFLAEYGNNHLSFGHGALHAIAPGLLAFVIPLLGYVTIFENKPMKYFWVYLGYWAVSLALMGGVIGAFGAQAV